MSKRAFCLCLSLVVLFAAITGRVGYISLSGSYRVDRSYNSISVDAGKLYTNIYSRQGERLNNNGYSYAAVIRPNEKCMSELKLFFNDEHIKNITTELSKGYPLVVKVDKYVKTKYIKLVRVTEENTPDMLCRHMLDKACGGLEYYTDEEIGSVKVNFSVDALGRVLSGDEGTVIKENYDSDKGITISIDKNIQEICEDAAQSLEKGSVVVLDTNTSQILAAVSRGGDYLNRSVSSYAVGSVFKLVVCACAAENRIDPVYTCKSKISVGELEFSCQKSKAHGTQNMKEALANSCNCYFVNLALTLGADSLSDTAKKFGFGETQEIYKGWTTAVGAFPDKNLLLSDGQLALLGFGQGRLTDSPLHFCSVVACIANGGRYSAPTLDLHKTTMGGRIITAQTADKVKSYMKYVVSDGTGANADYNGQTAGKTATAQSGRYENGREILNTWFAGFYPYENPKYAIVVMKEDGESGAGDCCPIFRAVVEKIDNM